VLVTGARLLADVRGRRAGMVDAGRFPSWVAAEEAALGGAAPRQPQVAAAAPASVLVEPLSQREREVLRLLGVSSRSAAVARGRVLGYL
jgi:hypothetical protein